MKIAITSKGTTLDAEVDPRFRKAAYILIVDTTNLSVEALDNSQNNALTGLGIQTAAMVNDIGATILLTGFCGPNAFKTLKVSGIKVANVSGTVREAVNKFNEGALSYADEYTMAPPRMKGKI
jgi:predicted Fe-Mo cluster-binding NifX family protein